MPLFGPGSPALPTTILVLIFGCSFCGILLYFSGRGGGRGYSDGGRGGGGGGFRDRGQVWDDVRGAYVRSDRSDGGREDRGGPPRG